MIEIRKIVSSQIVIILIAVVIGILLGKVVNEAIIGNIVMIIKHIAGQIIFFLVPLIVFAFVSSAIVSLKSNATQLLLFAFLVAYLSSEGAAFLSMALSYVLVPLFHIQPIDNLLPLPKPLFTLEIKPVMEVVSALVLAVLVGIGTVWIRSEKLIGFLQDFQKLVLQLVTKVLLPVLPFYIAANFCIMSYQGNIERFGIFLPVLLVVVFGHYVWLAILYIVASIYSGKSGWQVLRHYGPAYFTALGTMSSAATLGTAIACARKSSVLQREISDFTVPLFANIHLCGAMFTETFFLSVVSVLLYGSMPHPAVYALFIVLLGVIAVGAPGVPGGTAFASIGIVTSILGFDDTGAALLLALFALQDSFGTGCNILGDGALSLIVQKHNEKLTKINN